MADNSSLRNHGVEEEASRMFEMGEETMRLPLEEKMKYEQGDNGESFGLVNFSTTSLSLPQKFPNQIQSRRRDCRRCVGSGRHHRVHQYLKG